MYFSFSWISARHYACNRIIFAKTSPMNLSSSQEKCTEVVSNLHNASSADCGTYRLAHVQIVHAAHTHTFQKTDVITEKKYKKIMIQWKKIS